jgi:neutral ceramidase
MNMSNQNNFLAAAAQVDITPPLGTIIGVDFLPHYARFIHDKLYSKALVFKNQEVTIAIVVVDICIMDTDYMDEMKAEIQRITGIKPENILLSSNHNHASGAVVGYLGGSADMTYRRKLPALIIESVVKANANLKPAKIGYGSAQAPEYVVCRRYIMTDDYVAKNPVTLQNDQIKTNPFGGEDKIIKSSAVPDPEVCFVGVKDLDNNWISILGNYSLHYAADWQDDTITGDYFGVFADKIKSNLEANDDFVGIMSNGTMGNINIWDFANPDRLPKEHFAKSKLIGEALADRVVAQMPSISWEENPDLAAQFEIINIQIRKPNEEELARATKAFIENDFDNLSIKPDYVQRIYDREQVLLSEYPDNLDLAVQALKIDNVVIGALPGEFFAETGLSLKSKNKPYHYFSITWTNTYGGYIPPKHEMEKGGYETWRARTSCMEIDAEEKIRSKMNSLIEKF